MSEKFETGTLIAGTYRVLDFIGEGAMGYVYKVEHTLLNRTLAFKVLKTECLSEAIWKRFRLEGQAIARLDHINIVKIYDMSQTEDGLPFFTMDLLVGQSLDDYLQDYGRLSVEDALPIFRQVCAGLAYANDHGIIHRDIKPGNIMLIDSKDGAIGKCTVKIVDFGIAKLVDDGNTTQQGLTRPGEVFGSPLYMSPEQCMGVKLDQRTDMYSAGITMFQALTGKPPLLGKSAIETAALHQSQEPPMLCDVAQDVVFPRELEEVIATMLAKSPDDRYSSLAEVANILLLIEKGENITRPNSREWSKSRPDRESLRQQKNEQDDEQDDAQDNERHDEHDIEKDKKEKHVTKWPVLLVASLTVISLAAALFLVGASISLTEPDNKQHTDKQKAPIENPKTIAGVDSINSLTGLDRSFDEEKLSAKEKRNIEAFKETNTGNYSTIVSKKGRAIRVFNFPQKFSLGTIYWTNQKEMGHCAAKGSKEIPFCKNVKFESDLAVQTYPELLMKFRPDDIGWLVLNDIKPANPKLASSIVHLTSLNHLTIRNSEITDSDLRTLEQLKNLKTLILLSGTTVNSSTLAKSSLLKQLTVLQIESMNEPSALLDSLLKYNKLQNLDIRHVEMQRKDFAAISGMSRLSFLTIKNTNVTDEDLKALTKLTDLTHLNVDCCSKLTAQSIASLSKFTKLKTLILPDQLRNAQIEYELQKLIPNLSF